MCVRPTGRPTERRWQSCVFRVEVATGRRALWKEIRPLDVSATGVGNLYLTRDGRSGVYGYAHALVDLCIVNGLR